jgi:ubiquitin carboxyl-terminal hydrolase 7
MILNCSFHFYLQTLVVAQPETTVDSQPVKDPSPFRFTWKIDRFSQIKAYKLYSNVFEVGGFKWYCAYKFPKSIHDVHLFKFLIV